MSTQYVAVAGGNLFMAASGDVLLRESEYTFVSKKLSECTGPELHVVRTAHTSNLLALLQAEDASPADVQNALRRLNDVLAFCGDQPAGA